MPLKASKAFGKKSVRRVFFSCFLNALFVVCHLTLLWLSICFVVEALVMNCFHESLMPSKLFSPPFCDQGCRKCQQSSTVTHFALMTLTDGAHCWGGRTVTSCSIHHASPCQTPNSALALPVVFMQTASQAVTPRLWLHGLVPVLSGERACDKQRCEL